MSTKASRRLQLVKYLSVTKSAILLLLCSVVLVKLFSFSFS